MNKRNTRRLNAMKRVKQYVLDHVIVPAIPALTAESTALSAVITALDAASVAQDGGTGGVTGAVDERLAVAAELRSLMSSLAKAAKRLDKETYPDVATKMRMSGAGSFAQLNTRALLFKETLAPIKQKFVDLGASADVDEELDDLITALNGPDHRAECSRGSQEHRPGQTGRRHALGRGAGTQRYGPRARDRCDLHPGVSERSGATRAVEDREARHAVCQQ
jgi:hypothetical protein